MNNSVVPEEKKVEEKENEFDFGAFDNVEVPHSGHQEARPSEDFFNFNAAPE